MPFSSSSFAMVGRFLVGFDNNLDFPVCVYLFVFLLFVAMCFPFWDPMFVLLLFLMFFLRSAVFCIVFISMYSFRKVKYASLGGILMGTIPPCVRAGHRAMEREWQILVLAC